MKVLLDENMPHKLRQHLPGHEVVTVAFLNWGGIRNGQLLANAASAGFDVLLTMYSGIEYEQNLSTLPCSVVVVRAESNAFEHLQPHLPAILEVLKAIAPRSLAKVG